MTNKLALDPKKLVRSFDSGMQFQDCIVPDIDSNLHIGRF